MNDRITSAERASLQTLIRQREKVAKADVAEYAAVLSPEDLRMSRGVRAMQKALEAALIEAQRASGLEGWALNVATASALTMLVGDQGATGAIIPVDTLAHSSGLRCRACRRRGR
jgi:hypothetical protein